MDTVPTQMTAPLPIGKWMLYGILCVQTYVYSYNFPDDRRYVKIFAYFVFLLETLQTALTGADVYFWFAAGFGNADNLANGHFSAIDNLVMNAPISLIVQGFYCHRIWTLNKRWWRVSVVIAILSILQAIASVVWFFASSLADILIVVAMGLLLRQMRGCGGYSSYVFPRVVRLIIETNALTTATTIMSFVLCFYLSTSVYPMFLTGVIGKLFSNALFLTLNNRIYFREHPPPTSQEYHSTYCDPTCQPGTASPVHFVETTPSQSVRTSSFISARPNSILRAVEEDSEKGNCNVTIINQGSSQEDKCKPISKKPIAIKGEMGVVREDKL